MFTRFLSSHKIFTIVLSTIAYGGYAQVSQPSAAQRQKMAERHKQMAEFHTKMELCLESDKPISQCRQEMQDSCAATFGNSCPLAPKPGRKNGRGGGMMGGGPCWNWEMDQNMDKPSPQTPKAGK